jgi:hypothetical protein
MAKLKFKPGRSATSYARRKVFAALPENQLEKSILNSFGHAGRHIEEVLIRADATKRHRQQLITRTARRGLAVQRLPVSRQIITEKGGFLGTAEDIYLSSLLRSQGDNQDLLMVHENFVNMDNYTRHKFLAAALLEDPLHTENVSSSAYLHFVNMHCEQSYGRPSRRFTRSDIKHIKQEAEKLWQKMTGDQKLPFHLKAYLGTFAPRQLDGALLSPDDGVEMKREFELLDVQYTS